MVEVYCIRLWCVHLVSALESTRMICLNNSMYLFSKHTLTVLYFNHTVPPLQLCNEVHSDEPASSLRHRRTTSSRWWVTSSITATWTLPLLRRNLHGFIANVLHHSLWMVGQLVTFHDCLVICWLSVRPVEQCFLFLCTVWGWEWCPVSNEPVHSGRLQEVR